MELTNRPVPKPIHFLHSFNFLPQPPQSKTSGQRGLSILRWAMAKEAVRWVAMENDDDDEESDSDDAKDVD